MVDGVVHAFKSAVDDVDAVVGGVLDQLLHVAPEPGQVRGDAGDTHDGALGRGVPPRLVVRREHAQVRPADKVVVVQRQHRVGGIEEFRVEDDLDTIGRVVEELHPTDLVEDRVLGVVEHVVRDDRGQTMPFHGEQSPPQQDAVLTGHQVLLVGHVVTFFPRQAPLVDTPSDALLNHPDRVAQ